MISCLVFALVLLVPGFAAALEPSFDCAETSSSAEEAVCASDDLAALDRELARLYRLAVDDTGLDPDRVAELKAVQRGWIKGRDECWKAQQGGLDACIATDYALRIHELRQGYASARVESADAASTGPFAYRCDGLDALVSAVFVTQGVPMVSLMWGVDAIALPQVRSASGARYEGDTHAGRAGFWTKGSEATFTPPVGQDLACLVEPTG